MKFKKSILFIILVLLISCSQKHNDNTTYTEEQNKLIQQLSYAQGEQDIDLWPRTISIQYKHRNWITGEKKTIQNTYTIQQKPKKIIAQPVGIAEILYAILPHERLIAFHNTIQDSNTSILAKKIDNKNIFSSNQTEIVIKLQPDIVFVASYTSHEFQKTLQQANIPLINVGEANTIPEILQQISILGKITGEQGNAQNLIQNIQNILQKYIVNSEKPVRVLSYTPFYKTVAGTHTTFDSICQTLNIQNIATQNNIEGFHRVEAEWILQQNPDILIVTTEQEKKLIQNDILLQQTNATKTNNIHAIPSQHLTPVSQYILLGIHDLYKIIYK
ncbi:MAG: ABC transporter substrate-binding protein [Planctomycetes bacterium]|jgi:iron complex transport system substrate-binding protein|nr:ABC transporter substrate-binding protein [Planctomycetota bacterium]HNZ65940.1 ABC transporter substrate-binding protein [Planctomycetota bacterium]HPY75431.1 ABC transporter substrate-binding protein [Planctomycetota bacterium]HQB00861.1 ABC transporter substrate-binding protein [Planctomycetota bacterium]